MATFKGIRAAEFEEVPIPKPDVPPTSPKGLKDPVEVEWYCGLAIGPPRWWGTDIYECPECEAEGTTWVEAEDLKEENVVFSCPLCGQTMSDPIHYGVKE